MWECKTTTRNSFRSRDPLIYGLLDPTTSFRHGLSSKELLPYTSTESVYLICPQRNYILSSWQCTTFSSRKLFRPAFTGITGIFYVDQVISSSRMPWNLDFVRHSWENSGSARWIPWTRKLRVLVSNGGHCRQESSIRKSMPLEADFYVVEFPRVATRSVRIQR